MRFASPEARPSALYAVEVYAFVLEAEHKPAFAVRAGVVRVRDLGPARAGVVLGRHPIERVVRERDDLRERIGR